MSSKFYESTVICATPCRPERAMAAIVSDRERSVERTYTKAALQTLYDATAEVIDTRDADQFYRWLDPEVR